MDTFNIFTSIGTYVIAEGLLNICCCEATWWHAAELLGENIKAVYCSSVLAILRWTLWDSQKLMYTTKWDQEVSLAKFKLWQYGAERAERIMTVLNYSEELPLFSELKACQVVLFCHDRDSRALKAV